MVSLQLISQEVLGVIWVFPKGDRRKQFIIPNYSTDFRSGQCTIRRKSARFKGFLFIFICAIISTLTVKTDNKVLSNTGQTGVCNEKDWWFLMPFWLSGVSFPRVMWTINKSILRNSSSLSSSPDF